MEFQVEGRTPHYFSIHGEVGKKASNGRKLRRLLGIVLLALNDVAVYRVNRDNGRRPGKFTLPLYSKAILIKSSSADHGISSRRKN